MNIEEKKDYRNFNEEEKKMLRLQSENYNIISKVKHIPYKLIKKKFIYVLYGIIALLVFYSLSNLDKLNWIKIK